MSNIDKQWLQQTIADMEEHRDLFPGDMDDNHENVLAALRIALASLEAEPVYQVLTGDAWVDLSKGAMESQGRVGATVRTLYTAPPVPVSVPDELSREEYKRRFMEDDNFDDTFRGGWNACRAAMLQGAEPVTTAYKLPANAPCKDAPEHIWLQTAGVWPENGEFSELTWCSDNQHPDDTLYVRADVVAGNSPVIPDGWVACSERMPTPNQYVLVCNGVWVGMGMHNNSEHLEDDERWQDERHEFIDLLHHPVTHWMPLPEAPQQEV